MVMLGVTLVQIIFAIVAIYFGARVGDELRPRRARCTVPRVTRSPPPKSARSARPSLITRITNDVQQVQMLVVMICTLFVAAPITIVGGSFFAIREDGPLSLILVVPSRRWRAAWGSWSSG